MVLKSDTNIIQGGGNGWTGPTTCVNGWTCKYNKLVVLQSSKE